MKKISIIRYGALLFAIQAISLADAAEKGYFTIPGTDISMAINGKVHFDAMVNSNSKMTNQAGFSPASLDADGSEEMQTNLTAGQSKISFLTLSTVNGNDVKTRIEWDFFQQDGSAYPHLTHLWGEYGQWGAGQTFSVFMDISAFPDTLEYWGPNSMVFVRQPQLRYTFDLGGSDLAIAIENVSNSGRADPDLVEISEFSATALTRLPDLTAHYRMESENSHLQIAAILREVAAEVINNVETDIGFGVNISGRFNITESLGFAGQAVAGQGIGHYINDTSFFPSDGVINSAGKVEALPVMGFYAFLEPKWSDSLRSAFGFGYLELDDHEALQPGDFASSDFYIANLLYKIAQRVEVGGELQYGSFKRKDGSDDDNTRLQFSYIYKF